MTAPEKRAYEVVETSSNFDASTGCIMQVAPSLRGQSAGWTHCITHSRPTDGSTGVTCRQTPVLQGYQSARDYPDPIRGIRYEQSRGGKRLLLISGDTAVSDLSICSS